MRLLHTTELVLKEFFDNSIPNDYAILSHRWEEEEMSLQDFVAIRNLAKPEYQLYADFLRFSMNASEHSAGYRKILRCSSRGYEWVWIDTCCIDKASSAELSEAINSMYRWYQGADVCFAYLSDVSLSRAESVFTGYELSDNTRDQLRASKWFSRGWTLQELLAPDYVLFVDHDWKEICDKSSISGVLANTSRIPGSVLCGETSPRDHSVAQKMSWAAHRKTSRIEDVAYCLLGIFGVNMPLLYGEGTRAFARLQEEILKVSDDYSIFLWADDLSDRSCDVGLLAPSPAYFGSCNVECHGQVERTRPYRTTNQGLEWDVQLLKPSSQDVSTLLQASMFENEENNENDEEDMQEMYLLPLPSRPPCVLIVHRESGNGIVKDYQHFSRHALRFDNAMSTVAHYPILPKLRLLFRLHH
ncbi:hypothetical protein LTR10_023926 [Elasticomyces elasticus]|nr:hypothetical protein LTR10_023926 [Elasticomyces elasticus]KAK5025533.1 hypothetical protein LTR13_010372 [Exophiala sideris]KAK5029805.1 hypothetical protein LTS07_005529 [Exophiala sideris]KAK5178594.1 hypothetical protein LTR44_008965 [Eurotiomycetes sp. CCFEE 6388]